MYSIKERVVCLVCICAFFATAQGLSAEVKDRYLYMALGLASPKYDKDGRIDLRLGALETSSKVSGVFEIGPYYSLPNGKTLLGLIGNGVAEQHKGRGNTLSILQYSISLSGMHFLGREIGRGFFFRGDFGFAGAFWNTSGGELVSVGPQGETVLTEGTESGTGVGFLVSGGYAIPIRGRYTGLLNVSYANRFIKGERYSTLSFALGGFFD